MPPDPVGTIVCKFGGTSLADGARIRTAAELARSAGGIPVVVVSAFAGITNLLLEALSLAANADVDKCGDRLAEIAEEVQSRHIRVFQQVTGAATDRAEASEGRHRTALDEELARFEADFGDLRRSMERPNDARSESEADDEAGHRARSDRLLACGEALSACIMTAALDTAGTPSVRISAEEVIRTDSNFGEARSDESATRAAVARFIRPEVAAGRAVVVPGYTGGDPEGRTTTLGRGGSDLTAAILGAALDLPEIQIWTDVDGLLSADPRTVEDVRTLPHLGFEEAVELAYFGAKVIHPGAAKHALSRNVSIWIRSSFAPEGSGTLIHPIREGSSRVVAIAHKPSVTLIKVRGHPSSVEYGFLARVFEALARREVPVDLVATSHSSTAFTIDALRDPTEIVDDLSAFADVEVVQGLATVTVVGRGLLEEPGIDAQVFWAIGAAVPVYLISQASDVSLSFLIRTEDAAAVVRRLHDALVRDAPASVTD